MFLAPCPAFAVAFNQAFELNDSDRVVLLGNSLFERELEYGYIELAITTRWPDRHITIRNLGWSGDTVFGEARGYFTTPPDAYGHLIDQLTNAEPDVVIVAYGGIESYDGEEGLPRFTEGLHNLLDKIEELEAEAVMLSPIPKFSVDITASIAATHNQNVEKYTETISDIANERGAWFVNLFHPLMEKENPQTLTTNGIHLNESGYYYLVGLIESGLNLPPREWFVEIDTENGLNQSEGVRISNIEKRDEELRFQAKDEYLPLPLPSYVRERVNGIRRLTISGIPEGRYTLTIDGGYVTSATAEEWAQGVNIYFGTTYRQSGMLQNRIVSKNYFFFNQYRPQNRTYITGFRAYEQGQNVSELHQLNQFIERQEREIARLRQPGTNVYRLVRSR